MLTTITCTCKECEHVRCHRGCMKLHKCCAHGVWVATSRPTTGHTDRATLQQAAGGRRAGSSGCYIQVGSWVTGRGVVAQGKSLEKLEWFSRRNCSNLLALMNCLVEIKTKAQEGAWVGLLLHGNRENKQTPSGSTKQIRSKSVLETTTGFKREFFCKVFRTIKVIADI